MSSETKTQEYYPPGGFHYRVEFIDVSQDKNDIRFQSASGLSVEFDYESYKEGGENRFEHQLPVRTQYTNLVLARGMVTDSKLIDWFFSAFRDREFKPTGINVILLNEKSEPLKTWKVANAIPKKWSVSDFNASESVLVIETLELSYRYFTMK